jgi:hypothetical protein
MSKILPPLCVGIVAVLAMGSLIRFSPTPHTGVFAATTYPDPRPLRE